MLENWKRALKWMCITSCVVDDFSHYISVTHHYCTWEHAKEKTDLSYSRPLFNFQPIHFSFKQKLCFCSCSKPISFLTFEMLSEDWMAGRSCSARPLKLLRRLDKWICLCCSLRTCFCEWFSRLSETRSGLFCVLFYCLRWMTSVCFLQSDWCYWRSQIYKDNRRLKRCLCSQ